MAVKKSFLEESRQRSFFFFFKVALFTSGDGSPVEALPFRMFFSNLSPRMWLRCWAMTFCCSTPQWFSTDRMTGYSDTWTAGRGSGEGASEQRL